MAFIFDPQRVRPTKNKTATYSSFEVQECVVRTKQELLRFCVVYRSTQISSKSSYQQTRIALFFDQFNEYLDALLQKCGRPIIMGDFNFHMENEHDPVAQRFASLCRSKGLKQHVESSTHIAGGILDLVLTAENTTDSLQIEDLQIDQDTATTSDHYFVSFSIPVLLQNTDGTIYDTITYRDYDSINMEEFKSDCLLKFSYLKFECLNDVTDNFSTLLKEIIDYHAPEKTCKIKTNRNPWWNTNCNDARNIRRKAERRYKKDPTNPDVSKFYKEARIDAAIIINQQRNNYYRKKLNRVAGNAKETYKVINHLLDKEYSKSKLPNGTSDRAVAENLRQFFDSKIRNIYSEISEEKNKCTGQERDSHSFLINGPATPGMSSFEHMIEEMELLQIINSMPNKQCSLDPIPMFLLKSCAHELLPVISYIVNQSLQSGCFPEKLKTAVITPVLKKPDLDPDVMNNYRPISNLTWLSKILEKCVHKQLTLYLENNSLLSKFQSGYRRNFSCETAITRIHNDILLMIDKKTNIFLTLLDLSAAFDTVNHRLLLKKLQQSYGIEHNVLSWIQSYLTDRSFKVRVRNDESENCSLQIGVPQGSILGPILFILYTKSLETVVSKYNISVHFYADDTQLYMSFNVHLDDPDISQLSACFLEIKAWMLSNHLKLNEDKTEIIEIGPYENKFSEVWLATTKIKLGNKAKNLGFIFDDSLSLKEQLTAVAQKCNMNLRNLRRIGSKLSKDLKTQLVHSCILSQIDYCNAVYGSLNESQIQLLQKLQNAAVRFIFNLKKRDHITPYLKELHFLPVRERISYKIALLTFKGIHGIAPSYISELLHLKDPNTTYELRTNQERYILRTDQKSHFKKTQGAFSQRAPYIWNSLPICVRAQTDISMFKSALKTHY